MRKRILSIFLLVLMIVCLNGCGNSGGGTPTASSGEAGDLKVGVILIGDETQGYSAAHITGIEKALSNLELPESSVIWKYKVMDDQSCYDAAVDLVGQGCQLIIANSYGHQTYMAQAASEYPDVQFVSIGGDFAAISGYENLKNAFTNIYEARYVSGVVAGLKLRELIEEGTLTASQYPDSFDADGNIKIGYVGAFAYAEVISGYSAFYLGVRSVVPNVVMEVRYTNSWFDIDKEGAAAEVLAASGCVIIGQHADSTGAPAAVERLNKEGALCYSVGYNIDMRETAPGSALTSATNDWSVYYTYAFETVMNGDQIAADWSEGYAEQAVGITALGDACAEGTAEYVEAVEEDIRSGSLHIFDTSVYTVNGEQVTSDKIDLSYMDYSRDPATVIYQGEIQEAVQDGYFAESYLRSAPYFSEKIDGIIESAEEA